MRQHPENPARKDAGRAGSGAAGKTPVPAAEAGRGAGSVHGAADDPLHAGARAIAGAKAVARRERLARRRIHERYLLIVFLLLAVILALLLGGGRGRNSGITLQTATKEAFYGEWNDTLGLLASIAGDYDQACSFGDEAKALEARGRLEAFASLDPSEPVRLEASMRQVGFSEYGNRENVQAMLSIIIRARKLAVRWNGQFRSETIPPANPGFSSLVEAIRPLALVSNDFEDSEKTKEIQSRLKVLSDRLDDMLK